MKLLYRLFIICSISFGLFSSCSQESNSLMSRAYHNTTARYNAYYLAKEKMKIVEANIRKNQVDDHNLILAPYPPIDTNYAKTIKADLDYILERATYPIKLHKNSKWVDDSYILVGKMRLYGNENEFAQKTFRFVNTKGPDEQTRYLSLILLMRSYMEHNEWKYARTAYEYLSSCKLNSKNTKEFGIVKAQFNRKYEEWTEMLANMEEAIPHMKKRWEKYRAHYIAGQLHQLLGNDKQAYNHYKLALKGNPPYELSFYTKLNMSQVTELADASDVQKTKKYFKALLKDPKNAEYKDRIYYELGRFELKQNHVPPAIDYFNQSLQVKSRTTIQKGYSALEMGKIYYERLKKYTLSKAYYDTAVSYLNAQVKNYDLIVERKNVLGEFVKHYDTVVREDSLQRLAAMDSSSLAVFIDTLAARQERQARLEWRKKKEKEKKEKLQAAMDAQTKTSTFAQLNNGGNSGNFKFYNPPAFAASAAKFKEKWGDRPLEDNWRRKNKQQEDLFQDPAKADSVAKATAEAEKKAKEEEKEPDFKVDKTTLYKDIPFTAEAKAESNKKLKTSLYEVGRIYNNSLQEPKEALDAFSKLQSRFSGHEKHDEVWYYMYLICENHKLCDKNSVKDSLIKNYPNSVYTKLILNPNYLKENKQLNQIVSGQYEQAYDLYKMGAYVDARKSIDNTLQQYPDNDYLDKLILLRILTLGRTDQDEQYNASLKSFIADYKSSPLVPFAKELLDEHNTYLGITPDSLKNDSVLVSAVSPVVDEGFKIEENEEFTFLAIFEKGTIEANNVQNAIIEFNQTYFREIPFITKKVDFDDTHFMITVKEIPNKEAGLDYIQQMQRFDAFKEHYKNIKGYQYMIITKNNYKVLIRKSNLAEYITFYKQYYQ